MKPSLRNLFMKKVYFLVVPAHRVSMLAQYKIESIRRRLLYTFAQFLTPCSATVDFCFQAQGKAVNTPDRRRSPRFKLQTSLSFNRRMPLSGSEQTKAINISATGVCFATRVVLCVGEVVEVLLEIPKRVTGTMAIP